MSSVIGKAPAASTAEDALDARRIADLARRARNVWLDPCVLAPGQWPRPFTNNPSAEEAFQ
jgi:hypothetical protein